jgi:3-phosphoshikimate 1-carboxyvinyltransferase
MTEWKVRRAPQLQCELEVPGDKSISHRAVMLAAMSNGPCLIEGFLPSEDCL